MGAWPIRDRGTPERVDRVLDERRHLGRKRCQCREHFLVDHAQCSACGRSKKFAFDVSGSFGVANR